MDHRPAYWFRAKTYGWGWGLPIAWQGWVTLGVFFALAGLTLILFSPLEYAIQFYSGLIVLS